MKPYLVADLFCGAGGSSTGAERAVRAIGKKMTLVCVNHWPIAIETHKKNHPSARHYIEDVTVADPNKLVPEGYLDLLMASPECRFYSRARGGRPVHDQSRMNPWAIHRWLTQLDVKCLLVENVPEFVDWGPLLVDGTPDPKGKGLYFQSWVKAIWEMGYQAEWKYLNAADYGDATTRTRFFLIARKDGRPVRWPEPSHSSSGTKTMVDHRKKWRAAREIIDWTNPGRSLLDDPRYLKRPLSIKTIKRIAKGLEKFGGTLAPLYIRLLGLEPENGGSGKKAEPFIMGKQSTPTYRGIDQPVPSITTKSGHELIEPTLTPFIMGKQSSPTYRSINDPVVSITTQAAPGIIEPKLIPFVMGKQGHSPAYKNIDEPIPSPTTQSASILIEPVAKPFILGQHSCSAPRSEDQPIPTIMTDGAISLVNPTMVKYYGNDSYGSSVDEPVPTITTKERFGLVTPTAKPFIVQNRIRPDGDRVYDIDKPTGTVTGHGAGALVNPVLIEVNHNNEFDSRRLVLINGESYILDLRFRMLSNLELARAMGFSDAELTYEFVGNISEVTKQIGNAVPVNMAKALVMAILKTRGVNG